MKVHQILAGILVAVFLFIGIGIRLLGDWFWFVSVEYEPVFMTILKTRVVIWIIVFAVFFGFSYFNAGLAARKASGGVIKGKNGLRVAALISAFVAAFVALAATSSWETVLRFLNRSEFGVPDPVFGLDTGFFVFTLPFYSLILNLLLVLLIFTIVLSALSFILHIDGFRFHTDRFRGIIVEGEERIDPSQFIRQFLPQLSALLFITFAVIAMRMWLARYNLLFSPTGVVFGAGYTDIHVNLPVLTLLAVVAFLIGLGFLINEKFRRVEVITYGIAAFVVIAIVGTAAAGVMQSLVVEPDEFNLEKSYLESNIEYTLAAYGLDAAEEKAFLVNYSLTAEDIAENDATVENIRLWDWRPLKTTYEQLQLFRTYYYFNDVDVDRYYIDGMYKEVLVSAREMNIRSLPEQAQTWVNQHLVYTHGYGAVMNPVDLVSSEGLPVFYIKDIPPSSEYIELEEPRIYYGEETLNYIVTQTDTDELDYPAGEQNLYQNYEGTGGVALSSGLRRLVYALRFGSVELLVSGSLTPDSRLQLNRNVRDRAEIIAPFLSYDSDPYVVIADGRIYWIIDAYTVTDRYPYSEPVQVSYLDGKRLNYIRNSVKVVVDAYNGDVTYYVVDADDPIITTYQKIFPDLFRSFQEMPKSLQEHVRYPQGIFSIQASLYATYHMKDPRVFYNQEDAWVTPDEVYRGSRQRMEPYFIIMKLPGEESEEFILMQPFTPRNKENMIGWMAARADPEHYGELIIYQFSKQELTYGPMQFEARVDQDTEISQRITLWSQAGSSVVRGNTLVIPIENSILYVEPLYLEATERGTLPQLKRVIVAYDDRITMQETLTDALNVIFGEGAAIEPEPGEDEFVPITGEDAEKLARIAELYDAAQEALARGELGEYQRYIDEIGKIVSG